MRFFYLFVVLCLFNPAANAKDRVLNIAVASNFVPTMKKIVGHYQEHAKRDVNVLSGSTGKHYLQITYGAPIDVFFAADAKRPETLFVAKKSQKPFTYAIGKLAYYYPTYSGEPIDFTQAIRLPIKRIGLANPKHAPYGLAAREALEKNGLWQHGQQHARFVFGENVGHSYALIASKGVEAGFVAVAQIKQQHNVDENNYWLVPPSDYAPIHQKAVIVNDNEASRDFLAFFHTELVQNIIRADGYGLPKATDD